MEFNLSLKTSAKETCFERTTAVSLLEYANVNRHLDSFNDVTIHAGSDRFPANKLVLSCFSSFFEKMFKIEMKEKYQNVVEINGVDGDCMKILIEFIYTGSIIINSENVCKLLSASDYLQIEDVKQFCFSFLKGFISSENCFVILRIADRYQNDSLATKALQTIGADLSVASMTSDFKNLIKEELILLFSKLKQYEVEEVLKYGALMTWVKYNDENLTTELPSLFKLINLRELPHEFIQDVVLNEDLVLRNNDLCKLLLMFQTKVVRGLNEFVQRRKILCLGGEMTNCKVIEIWNCLNEQSILYPDLPEGRTSGFVILLQNHLYYIGGLHLDLQASKSVWKMNIWRKNMQWQQVASMNDPRYVMGAAVFDQSIVVAGGFCKRNRTREGEVYSPVLDSWKAIPPMNQCRSGNALVSCKGFLYSLGGLDNTYTYLSSVERMLPDGEKWKTVEPMQSPRNCHAAVTMNDCIYAIGGKASSSNDIRLRSVEKYDTSTNEWTYISDMSFCRSFCSAVVLQGRIYVVGGLDQQGVAVREIECYNPHTDTWHIVGITDHELYHHSLVVV